MLEKCQMRDSDIDWIFELRGYGKKHGYKSLKNVSQSQPSFFQDDSEKYRKKREKEINELKEDSLRLKGNTGDFEHLLLNRLNLPANPTQFGFDSTLRRFNKFKSIHGPEAPWKNLNINTKRDLLNTFLPPLTKNSLKNVKDLNKYISRPYEPVYDVKDI